MASGTLAAPGAGPCPPPRPPRLPASALCVGGGAGEQLRGSGVRRVGACKCGRALSEAEGSTCLQEVAALAWRTWRGLGGCLEAALGRVTPALLRALLSSSAQEEITVNPRRGPRGGAGPVLVPSSQRRKLRLIQPSGRPDAHSEACSLEQPSWAETLGLRPVPGEQGRPHSLKFRSK